MAKVYCLKEKKTSGECHLFECEMNPDGLCNCNEKSICKKMEGTERIGENIFSCKSDIITRTKVAEIGRRVCGTCISHLYETYD
jgi:hypothetical protein